MRDLSVAGLFCTLALIAAGADNWPGWRGPAGTGLTAERDLPLHWDGKTGENLLWKVPTGGVGHSSPIVWDDHVFLTISAAQPAGDVGKVVPDHYVVAFRATDGRELWRVRVPPGPTLCSFSEYAAPTPVTDGKAVYAWFGSGVAAAVDFSGSLLWRQQRDGALYDKSVHSAVSSSPALAGDAVIITYHNPGGDRRGVLEGLDKNTGNLRWQQQLAGAAGASTPLRVEVGGRSQLIVSARASLEGINPVDGTRVWTVSIAGEGCQTPSPAYDRETGLVLGGYGTAVDPSGTGDVSATHVRTRIKGFGTRYSSPTIAAGCVYWNWEHRKRLNCWDLKTGEMLYDEPVEEIPNYVSAIATADGLLYFVSAGSSVVVRSGPKPELVAVNRLGGGGNNCGASPAVSRGRIFVRDFNYLYCIGTKRP